MNRFYLLFAAGAVAPCAALLAPSAVASQLSVPQQFTTIQSAIDAAGPGDVIVVSKGKYAESLSFINKHDVVVQCKPGVKVTQPFGARTSSILLQDSDHIEVFGAQFLASPNHGIDAGNSSFINIHNCNFKLVIHDAIHADQCNDLTITDNVFKQVNDNGISLSAGSVSTVDHSVISRNKFLKVADHLATVHGKENTVDSNYFKFGTGATIRSTGQLGDAPTVFSNNTITSTGDTAIMIIGTGVHADHNKITKCGGDAVEVTEGGNSVTGNKIMKPGGWGVTIGPGADQNGLADNTITTPGGGVSIQSQQNTVERNTCTGSRGSGFLVDGGGNMFEGNVVKGSRASDLHDNTPGQNQYQDNKFKKVQ